MPILPSTQIPIDPNQPAPQAQPGYGPNELQAFRMMQNQQPLPSQQFGMPESPGSQNPLMASMASLGGGGGMEGNMPPGATPPINEGGMTWNPSTEMSDQFNELMKQYPTRNIGMIERIANAMLGAKNPQLALANMRAQSPEQIQWESLMKYLGQAAREERYANTQERQYATSTDRNVTAQQRLAETTRHNKEIESIRKILAERKNMQMVTEEDGGVTLVDLYTGEETPTTLNKLSEMEKLEFQAKTRKEIVGTQQSGSMARTQATVAGAAKRNEAAIAGRADLKRLYPTGGSNSAMNQRRAFSNAARQYMIQNPEHAQKGWISVDGEDVSVVAPGEDELGLFGGVKLDRPTEEVYRQMVNTINSMADMGGQDSMPVVDDGMIDDGMMDTEPVLMMAPDGVTQGIVDPSEVERLESQGYTRVQ